MAGKKDQNIDDVKNVDHAFADKKDHKKKPELPDRPSRPAIEPEVEVEPVVVLPERPVRLSGQELKAQERQERREKRLEEKGY